MKYIAEHAINRFKERYPNSLLPSVDYLINNGIKQITTNKKGHIVNNINRGIYRVFWNKKIIEYVMSKHKNGDIVIVTFNTPPNNITDKCFSYK